MAIKMKFTLWAEMLTRIAWLKIQTGSTIDDEYRLSRVKMTQSQLETRTLSLNIVHKSQQIVPRAIKTMSTSKTAVHVVFKLCYWNIYSHVSNALYSVHFLHLQILPLTVHIFHLILVIPPSSFHSSPTANTDDYQQKRMVPSSHLEK